MPVTIQDLSNYNIVWNSDSHEWYPKMEDIDYVHRLESVPLDLIEKYIKIKKSLKVGEKVVCINNEKFLRNGKRILVKNKIYDIHEIYIFEDFKPWIRVNEEDDFYPSDHFISLKKLRKDKLKKINE